jgi:hypothetical protein
MRINLITLLRLCPLVLVLVLGGATPSSAQDHHTLRIQNGSVFVDGERVAPEDLPESLRADDLQLHFEFTGADARFHLNGRQYGLKEGHVIEYPVEDDGLVVFFKDEEGRVVELPRSQGAPRRIRLDGTFGTYLQVLDEHADQFERIGAQLAQRRAEGQYVVAADQLREEAEQAAIMVRAFPRLEVHTYLEGLQGRDKSLYDQLIREQQMEVASGQLAMQIFAAPDAQTRRSLSDTLRDQLEAVFELKQQNRRDEIEQLELQLNELREQLAARERNRDTIISKRLEALVGRALR